MELTQQNRRYLIAAAIFILISLIFLIVEWSLLSGKSYYERKLRYKRKEAAEVKRLASEYLRLKKLVGKNGKRATRGSILAYLSSRTRKLGLEKNVTSIKPLRSDRKKVFEIRMDNLNLSEVVDFLFEIEKNSRFNTRVRRIQIRKKVSDPDHLELILQIEVE